MGIAVTCVEDDSADALLLQRALQDSAVTIDSFTVQASIAELAAHLARHHTDVILLDLGLPDSTGLESIQRVRELDPITPIIVLTGMDLNGLETITAGADDFLSKELIGGGQLARVLAFAVERHHLRVRVAKLESQAEVRRINAAADTRLAPVSDAALGRQSLEESEPELHGELTDALIVTVHRRLDAAATSPDVQNDTAATVRIMGERLARHRAGPDDIVRVLTSAVDRQQHQLTAAQFAPFVREARLLLIELMGHVVAWYRRHMPIAEAQSPTTELDLANGTPLDATPITAGSTDTRAPAHPPFRS